MDNNDILHKMRQERFVKNNGRVLRAVNVLREKYVDLSDLTPLQSLIFFFSSLFRTALTIHSRSIFPAAIIPYLLSEEVLKARGF